MTITVTPPIGTKGLFQLAAPFDVDIETGIEYTCQAIRRISDYLASNENPEELVYKPKGIESTYEEDSLADVYIVSLQSRKGHWLYVPARYILSYPSGNGIEYRALMLAFSLPSLPLETDLSELRQDIEAMIKGRLGVNVVSKLVETSQTVLIDEADHAAKQAQRDALKTQGSLFSRLMIAEQQVNRLQGQLSMLEAYIKDHVA